MAKRFVSGFGGVNHNLTHKPQVPGGVQVEDFSWSPSQQADWQADSLPCRLQGRNPYCQLLLSVWQHYRKDPCRERHFLFLPETVIRTVVQIWLTNTVILPNNNNNNNNNLNRNKIKLNNTLVQCSKNHQLWNHWVRCENIGRVER